MKRTISVTNKRVIEALDEAKENNRASKLVEEAILYYLDSIDNEYITKNEAQAMIFDYMKTVKYEPISNPNYKTDELSHFKDCLDDYVDDLEDVEGLL